MDQENKGKHPERQEQASLETSPRAVIKAQVLKKGAPIVSGPLFQARAGAAQILKNAQAEARRIVSLAHEQHAQIVAEARHAGRAEGKAEMTVLLAQAAKQAAALRMAHGERAIELAVQIAEKILAEQLSLEPERVLRVAQRALKSVCWCRAIVVRAHPADVAVMEKNRATLVKELSELNEIEIVADARQKRGGCIVESEIGEIDATLDTQLDALQKALLGEAAS